jgi:hypothetical protein
LPGQPSRDREWEHWPGRKPPDDGLRNRLKALFTPTEGEAADVAALIAERGREIDERTEQLAATVADLEQREEQTRRLRAAVEEMLRHGSAELDDRHARLTELTAELGRRESAVTTAERELADRRQELGAVELRRAAVERREAVLDDRETACAGREAACTQRELTLERIAAELLEREVLLEKAERAVEELISREEELDAREAGIARLAQSVSEARRDLTAAEAALRRRESHVADLEDRKRELDRLAATLDERQAELAARESRLVDEQAVVAAGRGELARAVTVVAGDLGLGDMRVASTAAPASHLVLVPGDGYRLHEQDGPPPVVETTLVIDGCTYRVVRVGRSPLPSDPRACVFVEELRAPSA